VVRRGQTPLELTGIVSAPRARDAWSYTHNKMLRITSSASDVVSLPEAVIGIGADPRDGTHVV
jgi:hypothetical protein